MNGRAIAELALRIWGLMLFIGVLVELPMTLVIATSTHGEEMTRAAVLVERAGFALRILLQAAVGAALIRWSGPIARHLVPEELEIHLAVSDAQLRSLGFALVGVFVLVGGLQDLAAAAYALLTRPRLQADPFDPLSFLWVQQRENLARALVQVVAGVILLASREGLARAWLRLRGRPVDQPS